MFGVIQLVNIRGLAAMEKETCSLCGQPVEIEGFMCHEASGDKHFCCAGCLSVYELLNENNLTTLLDDAPTHDNNNNEETP